MAFSRNRVWSTLVTCGALLLSASSAHGFVTYHAGERAKSAAQGYAPARVTIDTSALFVNASGVAEQAKSGVTLNIMLPSGKRYDVNRARVLPGLDGAQTFVGYFNSHGEDYRIYVTESGGAVSGIMMSPEGTIDIAPHVSGTNGNALLTSRSKAGHTKAVNFGNDSRIPPEAELAALLNKTTGAALITAEQIRDARERAKAGGQVTIDLLVGYTPGMLTRFSTASGVTSRLNTLVATMNDALTQSQVNLTMRLVHAAQVSYSDAASNDTALTAISPGSTDPAKTTLDNLRNQYAADLVVLIRPYQRATHGGCGLAWVLGYGGTGVAASEANYGFSALSDGTDTAGSGYYCDDLSFSHEVGHNLGLTHDRANRSNIVGATAYANGYINSAAGFGTIMSYASNRVARYSNPNIVCNGAPCGVARTDTANSADAAGAILTTMDAIAAFRAGTTVSGGPGKRADLSGDGKADIVWYNPTTGQTAAWLMNGLAQTASGNLISSTTNGARVVATGDFNGDGKSDLLVYNAATGETTISLMNGLSLGASQVIHVDATTSWRPVAAGDLNGDGKSDVIWHNVTTGQTAAWLMNGTTQLSGAFLYASTPNGWRVISSGDFDGDGKSDLIWYNPSTGQTAAWIMNGFSTSSAAIIHTDSSASWRPVSVGDLNGDGKADIVWYNGVSAQSAAWLMSGLTLTSGTFLFTSTVNAWKPVGTADYDGDGKSDLLWYNPSSGQSAVWIMNGVTPTSTAVIFSDVANGWRPGT
jgi:peptidyl-Asp metalloendopeptidase